MCLTWTAPLVQPKQWKRDMGFCAWNVRSPYKSGSLTTAARELARCKLDLVGFRRLDGTKGAI